MLVRTKKGFHALATDDRVYQGIEEREAYLVFGIDSDSYRVWGRDGQPLLYPKQFFDVIDHRIPSGWVFQEYDGGAYSLEPERTSAAGFYEDYFGDDGDLFAERTAREIVREVLCRMRGDLDSEHRTFIDRVLEQSKLGVPE